jgi:hypothetical protein
VKKFKKKMLKGLEDIPPYFFAFNDAIIALKLSNPASRFLLWRKCSERSLVSIQG